MSHESARERLGDYLEGQLELGARAEVDAHVADCASCRDELRGLRETVALLRGLPDPEPPADLTASVMARIDLERRPQAIRAAFRRLDASRVAALAAGFAGLALLSTWQLAGDGFPGATVVPAPERAEPALLGNAAGDADTGTRRLSPVPKPPAASPWERPAPRPPSAFVAGVAPPGFAELPMGTPSNRDRELDRQLDRLLGDPSAFLARMGPDARGERFARLAQHAARRQQARRVASRLIAVPHPLADQLVPRFLAASFAADFERQHPRR